MKTKGLPKGLFFRRQRDGSAGRIIWCSYYVAGERQPRKESTGTTDVAEAKRFRHRRMAEHPVARRDRLAVERITVSDALEDLIRYNTQHGIQMRNAYFLGVRASLGTARLIDLTYLRVAEVAERWRTIGIEYPGREELAVRMRPVTGATCNRAMAVLKRARNLAIRIHNIALPPLQFPHFAETARGKYLPPDDFAKILAHVTEPVVAMFFELAYLIAVRKGQLRATKLANVRVQDGVVMSLRWDAATVKTRVDHEVPLVDRAQEIVQQLWDQRDLSSRWLFQIGGRQLGECRTQWDTACRLAGFPVGRKAGGYVFHNTRHSCITNLAAEGVPDSVARSISGHRTPSVHARYQITQDATKRAALEAMSARVATELKKRQ